jgi:hypothetical protein
MPSIVEIFLKPEDAYDFDQIRRAVLSSKHISSDKLSGFHVIRRSIDARKKPIQYFLRVEVFIDEPYVPQVHPTLEVNMLDSTKTTHIIGFGPAGIFAALKCLELGIKPIVYERGKAVKERRRDLAKLTREHIVNPESNYCFGEGGAGTYSDGKLYTRSKKRGDLNLVLNTLVKFGAPETILTDAHPHIGTNKLPGIIENMRDFILENGGEIHFNSKLTDIEIRDQLITGIKVNDKLILCDNLILATGHSARDIFELLHQKNIQIDAKPFALGIRIEHPQKVIDQIQYKCKDRGEFLPPASYSLVQQVNKRGVYSFCMCPGGIIAPCATDVEEVVVNGWSPSKRDNPYANSGMVVEIKLEDLDLNQFGSLAGLEFQKKVERKAWISGGKTQKVPGQRMLDFINKKESTDLPQSSYIPGVVSCNLWDVLPNFVAEALAGGLKAFGKKMPAYYTNDALLHGVESRTSSPIRIPRDKATFRHLDIANLYPSGEGAGYAGGIVSAAIDGMRCAAAIDQD